MEVLRDMQVARDDAEMEEVLLLVHTILDPEDDQ